VLEDTVREGPEEYVYLYVTGSSPDIRIATVEELLPGWAVGEEEFANARLMAAAPELLEAARAGVDQLWNCGPWLRECADGCPTCDTRSTCGLGLLRAAIAKAEGREE
jgi:hypothetical protein